MTKQMCSRIVLAGIVALATAMFQGHGIAQQTTELSAHARVDHFVSNPIGMSQIQSLATLRGLGKVMGDQSKLVQNVYDKTKVNDSRKLSFDGLVVKAVFPEKDYDRGLIWEVVVTKPNWSMEYGIRIGMPEAQVREILGKPYEDSADTAKYCGDKSCATFRFSESKVASVRYSTSVE